MQLRNVVSQARTSPFLGTGDFHSGTSEEGLADTERNVYRGMEKVWLVGLKRRRRDYKDTSIIGEGFDNRDTIQCSLCGYTSPSAQCN